MERRRALLEERDAVVHVRRAGAALDVRADARAEVLAVALARQQDGDVERAAVAIPALHHAHALRSLGLDQLVDQRRDALGVGAEKHLDRHRIEGARDRAVQVRARLGAAAAQDRVETIAQQRHLRARRSQRARREEAEEHGEPVRPSALVVLGDGDVIEAPVTVHGRFEARLPDHEDARVLDDVAQLVGNRIASLRLEQPAGRVVAEEAEALARHERDLELAGRVRAQRVAAEAEEHEVIVDEPLEERAHASRALGAIGSSAPGDLHLRDALARERGSCAHGRR